MSGQSEHSFVAFGEGSDAVALLASKTSAVERRSSSYGFRAAA
jgi:hypothetical protein